MALHLNELKRPKVVFGSSFLSNRVFERGSEKRRARVEEHPDFGGRSSHFWSPSDQRGRRELKHRVPRDSR